MAESAYNNVDSQIEGAWGKSQDQSDLELFEQYLQADGDFDSPERGDLREGVIVEIRPSELLVNVGSKRDGVVPQSDLSKLDPEFVKNLQVGQTVDVVVSRLMTVLPTTEP